MFEEARVGFLKMEEANRTVGVREGGGLPQVVALLRNSQLLAADMYGEQFGTLDAGSAADLIVLDYTPPTPLTAETFHAHLVYGLRSGNVESSMINGRWVMWNRRCVTVDEDEVMGAACAAAQRLWSRMHELTA